MQNFQVKLEKVAITDSKIPLMSNSPDCLFKSSLTFIPRVVIDVLGLFHLNFVGI